MTRRPFVVLDRDGTLIVHRPYLSHPDQVELIPGAAAALHLLRARGHGLVLVTNQSGVGRGYLDQAQLARIHARVCSLLAIGGAHLDGIYFCPHTPDDGCLCRKPQPGLLQRAAAELGFAPAESIVVGDNACDIELGQRVGATTILVRTGYGAQVAAQGLVQPDHVAADIRQAVGLIAQGAGSVERRRHRAIR